MSLPDSSFQWGHILTGAVHQGMWEDHHGDREAIKQGCCGMVLKGGHANRFEVEYESWIISIRWLFLQQPIFWNGNIAFLSQTSHAEEENWRRHFGVHAGWKAPGQAGFLKCLRQIVRTNGSHLGTTLLYLPARLTPNSLQAWAGIASMVENLNIGWRPGRQVKRETRRKRRRNEPKWVRTAFVHMQINTYNLRTIF